MRMPMEIGTLGGGVGFFTQPSPNLILMRFYSPTIEEIMTASQEKKKKHTSPLAGGYRDVDGQVDAVAWRETS